MKARARKEAPRNPATGEAKVIDMLEWLRQRVSAEQKAHTMRQTG